MCFANFVFTIQCAKRGFCFFSPDNIPKFNSLFFMFCFMAIYDFSISLFPNQLDFVLYYSVNISP